VLFLETHKDGGVPPSLIAVAGALPESWVRGHVRDGATDPIPHLRFGRYVRFRWRPRNPNPGEGPPE
jgi:hypothetical protein